MEPKLPQSTLDALADAETLRRVSIDRATTFDHAQVFFAGGCGIRAVANATHPWAVDDEAARLAVFAAHAAFRACPGLR